MQTEASEKLEEALENPWEEVSPDKGLWRQSAHGRSGMVVESEAACSLEEALYVRSTIVFINDASRGRNANNRPGLPLPARHPSNFASHPLELAPFGVEVRCIGVTHIDDAGAREDSNSGRRNGQGRFVQSQSVRRKWWWGVEGVHLRLPSSQRRCDTLDNAARIWLCSEALMFDRCVATWDREWASAAMPRGKRCRRVYVVNSGMRCWRGAIALQPHATAISIYIYLVACKITLFLYIYISIASRSKRSNENLCHVTMVYDKKIYTSVFLLIFRCIYKYFQAHMYMYELDWRAAQRRMDKA